MRLTLLPKYFLILALLVIIQSCATYSTKIADDFAQSNKTLSDRAIAHTYYLIGDAGGAKLDKTTTGLTGLQAALQAADANSTLLFLGDNIYPDGLPKKDTPERELAKHRLDVQIDAVKNYEGRVIFIPGNHDWYGDGLKGVKRQEEYVEKKLGKDSFLPEDGCPMKKVKINEETVLLVIDSQWYLTNWNKHPEINENCDIKTKEGFLLAFQSQLKKNQDKTILVALHHPLVTMGPHNGEFTIEKAVKPVPLIRAFGDFLRKTTGASVQDVNNKHYREFSNRLLTMAQQAGNVIFASGHEHSLQYLTPHRIPYIVSGSGSKSTPTRLIQDGVFASSEQGYAKLMIYKDGSSKVVYFSGENNFSTPVFESEVLSSDMMDAAAMDQYPDTFKNKTTATIYNAEETQKSGFYKDIWGEHYRDVYSKEVTVPTVQLDTLMGGMTPTRKGGGMQSNSLRLETPDGREFVMRAVRKSTLRLIQNSAFTQRYVMDDLAGSTALDVLADFYTTAHPYATLAVGDLADAVGVYHTNPFLCYVPKQKALGVFNDAYGGELYIIEERVSSGHGAVTSFGNANEIISSNDLFLKLRKNEKTAVDQQQYIRSRIFDMLLGDWDRHEDQWRWAEIEDGKKKIYQPIPRDRDQVFSKFDGLLTSSASILIPAVRKMQIYDDDIRNVKWFNTNPAPLDRRVLYEYSVADWRTEAKFIQDHITDEVIEQAFVNFPSEVQGMHLAEIKGHLKARRANIVAIAEEYAQILKKSVIITATDKKDEITIERLPLGKTRIVINRMKDGRPHEVLDQTYDREETSEIWVYGLDGKDVFKVEGECQQCMKIKLIGGNDKDRFESGDYSRIKAYDHKSKKNEFNDGVRKRLSDRYDLNTYNIEKFKQTANQLFPLMGFRSDDGFSLGFSNTLTVHGFNNNPFSQQHQLSGSYLFKTEGFDLNYQGEFAHIFDQWNLGVDAAFTSPNFAINFFGFGNESVNDDEDFGLDYNRVRYSTIRFAPSLVWRGYTDAMFKVGPLYESIEVEQTAGRFLADDSGIDPRVFDDKDFIGAEGAFSYSNYDNTANPTIGMQFELISGFKANTSRSERNFGYVIPTIGFTHHLDKAKQLVFDTKLKGHVTIGEEFEFYQAAMIGGSNGLRGYREQRFNGQHAFYQNSDLRLGLGTVRTGVAPIKLGVFGGFDYGRVWIENDASDKWHNSYGGGVFFNALDTFTLKTSYFMSEDDPRFLIGMGLGL